MQHAIERVERPGESQEALDGKNILSIAMLRMPSFLEVLVKRAKYL